MHAHVLTEIVSMIQTEANLLNQIFDITVDADYAKLNTQGGTA